MKDKWDYWRQRAKSKLDDWGDKSTGFFFKSVKLRAVKNEIRTIKNEANQWIEEEEGIKNVFHKYFSNLLCPNVIEEVSMEERQPWLANINTISASYQQILEKPIAMEEVKKDAFSMKPHKTPGLDGTPPGFIQTHWEILKEDIFQGATSFFNSGYLLKEMN
ncbi:hypothetical protein RDABS01_037785 [Bienertia sinuspersici]